MTDDERQLLRACAGAVGWIANGLRAGDGRDDWEGLMRYVDTEIAPVFGRIWPKHDDSTGEQK